MMTSLLTLFILLPPLDYAINGLQREVINGIIKYNIKIFNERLDDEWGNYTITRRMKI